MSDPKPGKIGGQPRFVKRRSNAIRPSSLNPQPSTLNPQPSTLNPQPSTLIPQPSPLNPQPSTLSPQPSTLNKTHLILVHGGLLNIVKKTFKFVAYHLRPHSFSTIKTKRLVLIFCLVNSRGINQAISLSMVKFCVHQPPYHSRKRPHGKLLNCNWINVFNLYWIRSRYARIFRHDSGPYLF